MAIFKCKMCGGSLEITDGATVCECEYCGTQQTLPKTSDEQTLNMLNRANHFRQQCEFDKALEIYERLLNNSAADAEIYWSLVLCRYGIEYVDDPLTKKKIPTCHRTQFKSILEDADYLEALNHADSVQKDVYIKEAEYIDSVQRGILEISNKEEPFDVFICYKESDESGKRTPDSVLAQDLYYQLEREGFKVFFSRITLEGKLGTAYEPYIFAALNSAKVMVVVGTKPEYFNAVWVKNEWSRYLMLMQEDRSRTLIPAYKDMDPYDLPDALSMFQAQDMSKLGFMQDLIRGISKIAKDEPEVKTVVQQTVSAPASSNVENLLKRGNLALEDGKWNDADNFFEQVLNENVEEPRAYLGKLMVSLKLHKEKDFGKLTESFANNDNYKKTVRFADSDLKSKIENYNNQAVYNGAEKAMKSAENEVDFRSAGKIFAQLGSYSDSKQKAEECEEKALEYLYNCAVKIMNSANDEKGFKSAAKEFEKISDYKDSAEKAKECLEKAETARKEEIYIQAVNCQKKDNINELNAAISRYQSIIGYKDSKEQIEKCRKRIEKLQAEEEERKKESLRQHELAEKERQRKAKRKKIISVAAVSVVAVGIAFAIVLNTVIIPSSNYNKAMDLYNSGKYEEAITAFEALNGYKDSANYIVKNLKKIRESLPENTISTGRGHTVGLKSDGTVVVVGDKQYGQCDVSDCNDIVAISAGKSHTVGLKSDGTVVAVGDNQYGQCDVSDCNDIVAISAGKSHTVGLKSDGTVVAVGDNQYGQCDVSDCNDIVAISAGKSHTVGLKYDGTVVAVGDNQYGQCDVSDWTDIVAISAGVYHTAGLKSDGTVVAVGYNNYHQCDVFDWTDIVAVSAGSYYTVGLKSDGTVVAVGDNEYGQCYVSDWSDIVAVSAGSYHTVGLKSDGTVVAVGKNYDGECDVSDWTDIVAVSAGQYHTVGLKSDGTVVATAINDTEYEFGQCDVSGWTGIKTTN